MDKGKMFVIEGTEGTGKTIQSKMLTERMINEAIPVYHTMECSMGPIGRIIRNEYLSGKRIADRRLVNYLYAADRLDHITNTEDGMMYKLRDGINVVTDRYYMTSLALYPLEYWGTPDYQKQMEFIHDMNQLAYELCPPDLTIVLQVDPAEIHKRLGGRPDKIEIYDNDEDVVRSIKSYRDAISMLRARGEKIIEVDALGTREEVHERVWQIVKPYFL